MRKSTFFNFELFRMEDAIKKDLTILLAETTKITNTDRKLVATNLLKIIVQNPECAPLLMAPVGYLLKNFKGLIDSG